MKFIAAFLSVINLLFLSGCASIISTVSNEKPTIWGSCNNDKKSPDCVCHSKDKNKCYRMSSQTYQGTEVDAAMAAMPFVLLTSNTNKGGESAGWVWPFVLIAWPFAVIDLPLSVASDTILYPLHVSRDNHYIEESKNYDGAN